MENLAMMKAATLCLAGALLTGCAQGDCPQGARVVRTDAPAVPSRMCVNITSAGVVRHGPYAAFHDDGSVSESGTYRNGARHGVFEQWYANGNKQSVGEYRDGQRTGRWVFFDARGLVQRTEHRKDGVLEGPYTVLHTDGSVAEMGSYHRGHLHGPYQEHNTSGVVVAEGSYEDDLRTGPWTFRDPKGAVRERGGYANGLKQGPWEVLRPDGSLASTQSFVDDVAHGPARAWHPNGTKAQEGQHRHGHRYGVWLTWHANGVMASQGQYETGQPHGAWTYWDDAGAVSAHGAYEMGRKRDMWQVATPDGPRHQVGEQASVGALSQSVSGVMLGRIQSDGTVWVLLPAVLEPGTTLWIHQDALHRRAATLVDIREGHMFEGAHPQYDQRLMGVLAPTRPLVRLSAGVAQDVVLVTRDNTGGSPLETAVGATGTPSEMVLMQVDALSQRALVRAARQVLRSRPPPSQKIMANRTRNVVRAGKGLSAEREVHVWTLGNNRSLVTAHVSYKVRNRPSARLAVDFLVDGDRVVSWDVAQVTGALVGASRGQLSPYYEALFDHDNDGWPEIIRQAADHGRHQVTVHELEFHGGNMLASLLSERYGM